MKKIIIIIVLSAGIISATTASAQMATMDEALTVADNWVVRVIQNEGNWGGYDWAQVANIQEFKRDNRIIGYFCRIEPVGFIIVSLRKELAPVKAYSDESNLDPDSDEGMADLLKMKMEAILDAIEQPIQLQGAGSVQDILEIDYRPAWDKLNSQTFIYNGSIESEQILMNYQQGRILLSSTWHQGDPYNSFCPIGDTTCISGVDRTVVGCAATAAAQIMQYWAWPPKGIGSHSYYWDGDDSCPYESTPGAGADWLNATFNDDYDWLNMSDSLTESSDPTQINAVAELCYEIGVAVEMDYGVCGSSADLFNMYDVDMYDAYINYFRYSQDCSVAVRCYSVPEEEPICLSQEIWFRDIKEQLNLNRPIQYAIPGHSIIVDGWHEDSMGKKYHINYGWRDENKTMWYNLDEIDGGKPNEEGMLVNIYPDPNLGSELIEERYEKYEKFPYRYFDQDATGESVTFAAGQNLQFLPGVKVECTGGDIEFQGEIFNETQLFSIKGTKKAEVNILDGAIILYEGGGIRFH